MAGQADGSSRTASDAFDCGVRVVQGEIAGEGRRWTYRTSALDPLVTNGVVTLNHGPKVALRLSVADLEPGASSGAGVRPFHQLLDVVDLETGARVQLSVADGNAYRFEAR